MSIIVNPFVQTMEAYIPGEQPSDPDVIKLNTNESPYPAAPEVLQAIADETALGLFNKYPDPSCSQLRSAVANRLKVTPEEIVCGNGSDETLRMLVHTFIRPGKDDKIAVTDPTYVLYSTLAAMYGAQMELHSMKQPDYAMPESLIEAQVKIIFLPNPNPPIGVYFENADLECLAAADPDRLVVIDEAYVDFAPNNAMDVYRKYENVVILRTFSKSYSLAGLRAGFAILRPKLAEAMNKIKDSYNVNRLTQAGALAAWNATGYYATMVERIKEDRSFLTTELISRGFAVPSSQGNFVFPRKSGAGELYQKLKDRKILVRYFNTPELKDGLRITVGTRTELDMLLRALDEIAG